MFPVIPQKRKLESWEIDPQPNGIHLAWPSWPTQTGLPTPCVETSFNDLLVLFLAQKVITFLVPGP